MMIGRGRRNDTEDETNRFSKRRRKADWTEGCRLEDGDAA